MNFIASFVNSKITGFVKFEQCCPNHNTLVIFKLKGFAPNSVHACHIHEYGDLTDGCKTLGGHLNLKNTEHGTIFYDIHNSHTGDLINNIESNQNGEVSMCYEDPRLNLFENVNNSIVGCSVVIHEGQDDYGFGSNKESKITGNAGGRMACAVIGKMSSK